MKSGEIPDKLRRRFLKLCEKKGIDESAGIREAILWFIANEERNP